MFGTKHTHTHFHFHGDNSSIRKTLKKILMTQEEAVAKINELTAQTQKSNAEINQKLTELQDALAAAGNVTPAVEAALAGLAAVVQANDDLIADAPTEEPALTGQPA